MEVTDSIEALTQSFERMGIEISEPGFYDHTEFLRAEKNNPTMLEYYAAFVTKRAYEPDYLDRVRATVPKIADVLHNELVADGRLGACVDVSGGLSRMLDKEGIWNFPMKGALTIKFPTPSTIRHYWAIDEGEFVAPHAWVVAPPFTIIDITIKQQQYIARDQPLQSLLPEKVIIETASRTTYETDDLLSPVAISYARQEGLTGRRAIRHFLPRQETFSRVFLPQNVRFDELVLKYVPVAVGFSDVPLEQLASLTLNGLAAFDLYERKVRPVLRP